MEMVSYTLQPLYPPHPPDSREEKNILPLPGIRTPDLQPIA